MVEEDGLSVGVNLSRERSHRGPFRRGESSGVGDDLSWNNTGRRNTDINRTNSGGEIVVDEQNQQP